MVMSGTAESFVVGVIGSGVTGALVRNAH